ncbi:MAG: sulfite exporter TauE/SafE family protein [Actinomycetota bacterium]
MYVVLAILIGFAASVLSGMFGIGGSALTTPAIRLLLDASPAIALGTPLPVTIPTAAAGAFTYARRGLVDRRVALWSMAAGLPGAALGALLTRWLNLHYLMLATGAVILYLAFETARRGIRGGPPLDEEVDSAEAEEWDDAGERPSAPGPRHVVPLSLATGFAAGLFSGLLGVGGGLVLIPGFLYLLKMPLKKVFGTSLAVIVVIAIPGTAVHSLLHHVNWTLALYLTIGAIPGAILGARITIRTPERTLYLMFASLLAVFGVLFIVNEIISMIG